jgi:hypothetical protein
MNDEQKQWYIDVEHATPSRFKKVRKRYPREYVSCFANLDKIVKLLNAGHALGALKIGFFRSEKEGLYRVRQTGVQGSKEMRLYVFADVDDQVLYVLEIGTKETQRDDLKRAKDVVSRLK